MQRKRLCCAVICCSLTLATTSVRAEDGPGTDTRPSAESESLLRVGARVRLNQSSRTLTGRVLALDDRNILLQVRDGKEPIDVRLADIQSVEVSVGRRSRTGEGAVIGATAFIAWSTIQALALDRTNTLTAYAAWYGYDACDVACAFLSAFIAVGAVGAGLGALAGSAFTTDVWRTPTPKRLGIHVLPTGRGVAASLSFRF